MKRNILLVAIIVFVLTAIVAVMKIQSPTEYYQSVESFMSDAQTVTLSINCVSVNNNMDKLDKSLIDSGILPKDGVISTDTAVLVKEEDSVFDVLERYTKQSRIQFEFSGEYVKSIYNLREFSCGPLSGWMFKVNGEFSTLSAKAHKLKAGDRVEWVYTCDLGRDIGDTYGGER